jgi:hypothetical protein
MKLLRWTLAGASFYVIYKYAIGQKAKGEEVFQSPENSEDATPAPAKARPAAGKAAKPKGGKARAAKAPSGD